MFKFQVNHSNFGDEMRERERETYYSIIIMVIMIIGMYLV